MKPKAMRAFQEVFDAEAAILADDPGPPGRFGAVQELAEIFPSVVFPRALGVDGDTREALLAYGSLSFNAIGPRNRHLEVALQRAQGVPEWIAGHCARDALRPRADGMDVFPARGGRGPARGNRRLAGPVAVLGRRRHHGERAVVRDP